MFPFTLPVEGVFVFVQSIVVLMKASNAIPISKIEKVSGVSYFLQYFLSSTLNLRHLAQRSMTILNRISILFGFSLFFIIFFPLTSSKISSSASPRI